MLPLWLAAVSPILLAFQAAHSSGSAAPLTSRLLIKQGYNGGITSPRIEREVFLARDWRAGVFRAVVIEERKFPRFPTCTYTCEVSAERFGTILRSVVALGLPRLPENTEDDFEDIYDAGMAIEFTHKDIEWHNCFRSGCVIRRAVHPTQEQRELYATIAEYVIGEVYALPLQEVSTQGFSVGPSIYNPVKARIFVPAVLTALEQTFGDELDIDHPLILGDGPWTVRFPWGTRPGARPGSSERPLGYYDVRVDSWALKVVGKGGEPPPHDQEDRQRRHEYVNRHPNLTPREAQLISVGRVASGMTEEMVEAALGVPSECYEGDDPRNVMLYYPGGVWGLSFQSGVLVEYQGDER
jgi:hypothetical protein